MHEIDCADTDIVIVELPKKDGYVFAPLSTGTGAEGEEAANHADFEDPLKLNAAQQSGSSCEALTKLPLSDLMKKGSR